MSDIESIVQAEVVVDGVVITIIPTLLDTEPPYLVSARNRFQIGAATPFDALIAASTLGKLIKGLDQYDAGYEEGRVELEQKIADWCASAPVFGA